MDRLAETAGVSASYGRALLAEFQADPTAAAHPNGRPARPDRGRAVTATVTIWRTCPACGASFEQPDDPAASAWTARGRASRPPTRARQRQRQPGWQQRTGCQEWRSNWYGQRHQCADSGADGADQRQRQRQEQQRPPAGGASGQRPGASRNAARG